MVGALEQKLLTIPEVEQVFSTDRRQRRSAEGQPAGAGDRRSTSASAGSPT